MASSSSALSGGTHRLLPFGRRSRRPGIVTMLLVFSVLMLANSPIVLSLDIRWCRQPLGLQSGAIPDSALSASSAFDGPSVGPQHARLHVEKSGGAWCPKQQIAENVNEYLQIDLAAAAGGGNQSDSGNVVISGIATQGRWGNGRGQEYAEQFRIHYWRPELAIWRLYRSWNGDEILDGNSDTKTAVHHDLNPPIIASRVRIIPHGIYPRTVCMRVELYGCRQNGNIVSYSIPVGDTWSGTLILDDLTYDGFKEPNEGIGESSTGISQWRGGLGMLTDGHYGLDNFKIDLGARKGHGWVGWKKDSFVSRTAAAATPRPSLQLLFKFSSPRNLSAVHIHTNNYFSKNVQVFSKASLSFSLGGSTFGGNFNYYYMEDTVLESARNVSIRMPNNVVATYVKIQLWFSSHWIMISEVTFDSEMVEGHPGNEFEDQEEDQDEIQQTTTASLPADPSTSTPTGVFNTAESAGSHGYFEAVVGALSAVMLLLIVAIVVIILMNHRKKCVQETIVTFSAPFDVQTGGVVKVAPSSLDVEEVIGYDKPMPVNNLQYISQHSIITGDLNKSTDPDDSGYATASVIGLQHNQFSSLRTHHLPAVRYHSSGVSLLGSNQAVGGGHFPRVSTDPISRRSCGKSVQLKSASNIGFVWNIRPLADSFVLESASKTLQVPEIPRQSLRLVEWLGSSAHGEAYVCHVMSENNSDYENNMSMKQPVVVRGGPIKEPKNFQAEIKMLASLQHPNVCSLLAYSNSSGTGWMIFECPVYGDLNTYLKQQSTEMSNANLLKMVCQIARAMEYLEGKGLVHKDLASRNCLLGPELHVKVSDLAVVTTAFKEDYGEVRGRKPLPLRWLPWETLVLGKFTEYSGVWMLAVTVWELATGARERPFHTMNDTQVILNADHFYYSDGREVILSQPKGRPCQLYKWMMSCWSREESLRPTFHESATFLDQLAECF